MEENISCVNNSSPNSFTSDGDIFAFLVDTILVGCISVGGLIVNAFTFLVLWNERQRSSTFFFLRALAIADGLYLVHCLLFQVFRSIYPHTGNFKQYFDAWPYMEPFEFPFGMMSLTASIWLITLMALDRSLHLRFPFLFQRYSSNQRIHFVELVVLIVLDIGLNSLWFFRQKTVERWDGCRNVTRVEIIPYAIGESRSGRLAHTVVFLTFVYGVPIIVMTVANVLLIATLRSHSEFHKVLIVRTSPSKSGVKRNRDSTKSSSNGHVKGERRITALLIVMIVIYLVCQTPVFVNHILYALGGKVDLGPDHRYYNIITNAMVALNSAINFFVYLIFVNGFRKRSRDVIVAFFRTLCPCTYAGKSLELTETMTETMDKHSHILLKPDGESRESQSRPLSLSTGSVTKGITDYDSETRVALLKPDETKV